jgi:hypothetical protein
MLKNEKEQKIIIDRFGNKFWKLNGKYHRLDGPAIEYVGGHKEWRIDGKLHRLDGPARVWPDGVEDLYVDGVFYYTQNEHALAVFWFMNDSQGRLK